MIVLCTSDDIQTRWAVREIAKLDVPVYLRLCRMATPVIYSGSEEFEIGKGIQIGDGKDATIFATGVTVNEALEAKKILKEKDIDVRVVDIHTIKPIDKELIIKCAKETNKLISVEDHNVIGGLGTAISEVLTENCPKKLVRMGIEDTFGKSGRAEDLMKYYGIDSNAIAEEIIG